MAEDINADEDRMIDFKCPYCGENVSYPAMDAEKPQACIYCQEVFIVPKESCDVGRRFPLPIKTERLLLRRLAPGDVDALTQLVNDKELFTYHSLPASDEEDVAEWIERDPTADLTRFTPPLWLAVTLLENEKLIGMVSFGYSPEDFRWPEISAVIARSGQRKGYATEALRALLKFGFYELNIRRITAECDTRNEASIVLATKIGMRREGTFFETRYAAPLSEGQWADTAFFAMLKKEFDGTAAGIPVI